MKRPKSGFWNILPKIEKIPKWTPKNQKFENPSTTQKFYVNQSPIKIFESNRSYYWK